MRCECARPPRDSQAATTFCASSFNANHGAIDFRDQKQSALNAAAAGIVLMCIANYAVSPTGGRAFT